MGQTPIVEMMPDTLLGEDSSILQAEASSRILPEEGNPRIALRGSVAMGRADHITIATDRVDVITQHLTTQLQQPPLAKGVAHDRVLGPEVVASTTRPGIAFLLGPDIRSSAVSLPGSFPQQRLDLIHLF